MITSSKGTSHGFALNSIDPGMVTVKSFFIIPPSFEPLICPHTSVPSGIPSAGKISIFTFFRSGLEVQPPDKTMRSNMRAKKKDFLHNRPPFFPILYYIKFKDAPSERL